MRLRRHALRVLRILFDLVKVEVTVDLSPVFVHDAHAFVKLFDHPVGMWPAWRRWQSARPGEISGGVLPRRLEIAGRGGDHGRAFAHLGLVARCNGNRGISVQAPARAAKRSGLP